MSYNFGSTEQFEKALREYYEKKLFFRLFPRNKRFHEIAERIHGEMTPEQFFEAWDRVTNDRLEDDFPAFPLWLKHFADLSFRQEFKVYWYQRRAEFRAKFGRADFTLDLFVATFRYIFYFSLLVSTLTVVGQAMHIDPYSVGATLGILILFGICELLVRNFFVISGRTLRCAIHSQRARRKQQSAGQGLVEYALILVLVAIVVIVILVLLGPAIGNVFSNIVEAL